MQQQYGTGNNQGIGQRHSPVSALSGDANSPASTGGRREAQNIELVKHETEALRLQVIQMQEDFHLLQDSFDAMKNMLKRRASNYQEQLASERRRREVAEGRVIHMEDRCRFVEENLEAMTTHLKTKCSQKRDDVVYLKARLANKSSSATLHGTNSGTGHGTNSGTGHGTNSGTSVSSDTGGEDHREMSFLLGAREQQLKRLATELDTTHWRYIKQVEDNKRLLDANGQLQIHLINEEQKVISESREKDELQLKIARTERAAVHYRSLSTNSMPVLIPVPDSKRIRTSPFLIPPHEYLAELRGEVQSLLEAVVQQSTAVHTDNSSSAGCRGSALTSPAISSARSSTTTQQPPTQPHSAGDVQQPSPPSDEGVRHLRPTMNTGGTVVPRTGGTVVPRTGGTVVPRTGGTVVVPENVLDIGDSPDQLQQQVDDDAQHTGGGAQLVYSSSNTTGVVVVEAAVLNTATENRPTMPVDDTTTGDNPRSVLGHTHNTTPAEAGRR